MDVDAACEGMPVFPFQPVEPKDSCNDRIAAGGIDDVDAAIALLDAGAQRVSTNAAGLMVETLMGVAA